MFNPFGYFSKKGIAPAGITQAQAFVNRTAQERQLQLQPQIATGTRVMNAEGKVFSIKPEQSEVIRKLHRIHQPLSYR